MRSIKYEELLKLDYSEIRSFTTAGEPLVVPIDPQMYERVKKFLANEERFRASKRGFWDRMSYVINGIQAIRLSSLMPLWNRAMMDGYGVQVVRNGSDHEIVFAKKLNKSHPTIFSRKPVPLTPLTSVNVENVPAVLP